MVLGPSFHASVRQTFSNDRRSASHHPGHRDEHVPLLAGRQPEPAWWDAFFNITRTPGCDSPNLLVRWPANTWHVTKATLLCGMFTTWFLPLVPLGILASRLSWHPTVVLVLNALAMMPLVGLIDFALNELSPHLGEFMGGLVNGTLGLTPALVVGIIALIHDEPRIAQASIVGTITVNLLLTTGFCCLLGGLWNMRDGQGMGYEQNFYGHMMQGSSPYLMLATALLLVPALLHGSQPGIHEGPGGSSPDVLSLVAAVTLLVIYLLYLWFQLRTHNSLFSDMGEVEPDDESDTISVNEYEEEIEVLLSPIAALLVFLLMTAILILCAQQMMSAIDRFQPIGAFDKSFLGFFFIPVILCFAQSYTAAVVAIKNKMDLAIGLVVDTSIQTALFVGPVLVILSWQLHHQPLDLNFPTADSVSLLLSTLAIMFILSEGKSTYLTGAMLSALYILLLVAPFVDLN